MRNENKYSQVSASISGSINVFFKVKYADIHRLFSSNMRNN